MDFRRFSIFTSEFVQLILKYFLQAVFFHLFFPKKTSARCFQLFLQTEKDIWKKYKSTEIVNIDLLEKSSASMELNENDTKERTLWVYFSSVWDSSRFLFWSDFWIFKNVIILSMDHMEPARGFVAFSIGCLRYLILSRRH